MASDLHIVRLGSKEIMEISKPRIVVLLVITAVTSMYAASKLVPGTPHLDYLTYLHIIIAGALASAGSSALNHYYDKDIDPKMTRTSTRPIPSGRMAASHVLIYGLVVSCISVIYGYFALNAVSAFFIALGIFSYVIIYTVWLKRIHTSNIVIGGIAGSAAAWAGWSAATGSMDLLGFLVGFLVFVWTPSHFWCLAMKIKDEYAQAKIPMLPVVIGMQRTSKYILGNTLILFPYSLMLSAFGMGIV
ncbi:MAG: heme o synthase, partial [Thermoproteota archaeon]